MAYVPKGTVITKGTESAPAQYKDVNGVIWTIVEGPDSLTAKTTGYGGGVVIPYTGKDDEEGLVKTIDDFADNHKKTNYLPWLIGGGVVLALAVAYSGGGSKRRK